MKCAASLIKGRLTPSEIRSACRNLNHELGARPDLVVVFVAGAHASNCEDEIALIQEELRPRSLIGCTSESVIGVREEVEHQDAISLWAATWPGARLTPMHLTLAKTPEGDVITGWPDEFRADPADTDFLVILADPFSFPAELLLDRMAEDQPDLKMVGGMASRGYSPGENRLFVDELSHTQGAIALLVQGGIQLHPVLSQGCRPIGTPMVITQAAGNEVMQLGGRPVIDVLRGIHRELPVSEQRAMQRGLLVGRVIDEYQSEFAMGDFLIRGVVGIDEDRGSIAVSDYFRAGQTIQFHIRDQGSADADFRQLLANSSQIPSPLGGLIFSCNGRGSQMFGSDHHDALCVDEHFDDLPLAGFFAAGEIGPVGRRSFMHGFTASLALFSPL